VSVRRRPALGGAELMYKLCNSAHRRKVRPGMPTISWFYGISIRMYFNDHAPPHFHAFYGRHEARISIETGGIIGGHLPKTQSRLVRAWTLLYHDRLMADWALVRADYPPERIPGLDADGED
jgi:hypothetical protein